MCDMCVQLSGHGSLSELNQGKESRQKIRVLLAEDNLINMKVSLSASLHPPSSSYSLWATLEWALLCLLLLKCVTSRTVSSTLHRNSAHCL